MHAYLSGQKLYGDDFTPAEIDAWFADEREGYLELAASNGPYHYAYHQLNIQHGLRHLPERDFPQVLGLGSAAGDEFDPIRSRCGTITILEPSDGFRNPAFEYVKPHPSGRMPFATSQFDLITCFSVLHHIPNVTTVVTEINRVLRSGGYIVMHEPIVSMGDWSVPRKGLTKHERGIPIRIFREILAAAGLEVRRERLCAFSLTSRWQYLLHEPPYNQRWVVKLDEFLCSLPVWFRGYHPRHVWQKLRPMAVAYVLTKS